MDPQELGQDAPDHGSDWNGSPHQKAHRPIQAAEHPLRCDGLAQADLVHVVDDVRHAAQEE